jgi:hypothetical protein
MPRAHGLPHVGHFLVAVQHRRLRRHVDMRNMPAELREASWIAILPSAANILAK